MNVFEILVIKNPTPNEQNEGVGSQILFSDKIEAPSRDLALMKLGRQLTDEILKLGHRLQIHVKGF